MKTEPRITLIILPIPFLIDQKRNAPLGILYIAGRMEQIAFNSDLRVVDLRNIGPDKWLEYIPEADIYGISATSVEYQMAADLAHKLKEEHECITVLGGVHASVTQRNWIDPVFDIVVRGEGEYAMQAICMDYIMEKLISTYSPSLLDVDELPMPARYLLPHESIVSNELVDRETKAPATTIITSRGCPHDCSFCSNKTLWDRKVRFRSVDKVVEEINHIIAAYGVRHFRFHDDSMTINKNRLRKLSEALSPLGITWRGNARVGEFDQEAARLMKSCGCVEVGFGIESASQEALDMCRKKVTVMQNAEAIAIAKEAGLQTKIFFIIGLPGDTGNISGRTIKFIKETKPDAVNISTLAPLPGCDIYEHSDGFGIVFRTRDISKYRFFYGLNGGECDEDFAYEYPKMRNSELKYHRRKILEFIAERGLDKIK